MNKAFSVAWVVVLAAVGSALAAETPRPPLAPKIHFGGQFKHIATGDQGSPKSLAEVQLVGLSRVPKFGFRSNFAFAGGVLGEHITEVRLGSAAERMGLAVGDVILAVNGQPLRDADSWYDAVDRASQRDGWVTLKILERRTGATAYRTANLFKLNLR